MKVERPAARSSPAPTREKSRSTMPICAAVRRHETARLRQYRDQRILAQEGGFAGHVGAGHQPEPALGHWAKDRSHWAQSRAHSPRPSAASTTGCRPRVIAKADTHCPASAAHNATPRSIPRAPTRHIENRQRARDGRQGLAPPPGPSRRHFVEQHALPAPMSAHPPRQCGWRDWPARRWKNAPPPPGLAMTEQPCFVSQQLVGMERRVTSMK